MAVPEAILLELEGVGDLDGPDGERGPIGRIQHAIDSLVSQSEETPRGLLEEQLNELETSVREWLEFTRPIEDDLQAIVIDFERSQEELNDAKRRDDNDAVIAAVRLQNERLTDGEAGDALGRLCGLSQLHLAIACDVAAFAHTDELEPDESRQSAGVLPLQEPRTIREVAEETGALLEALRSDLKLLRGYDSVDHDSPESDAMGKILARATDVTKSVLKGSVPLAGAAFSHIQPVLSSAALVGPAELQHAVRAVAGHVRKAVGWLIRRVRDVIEVVRSHMSASLNRFIDKWAEHKEGKLTDGVVTSILNLVFDSRDIAERIAIGQQQQSRMDDEDREDELKDLLKSNHRWIGPASCLAKGLPFLGAVPPTPIPPVAIAAAAMLAWTLLITGDQLDARGPFPKFWDGIVSIAAR